MSQQAPQEISAEIIEVLVVTLLSRLFDDPSPTPEFHKTLWELVCNPHKWVAIAAPRGHAKSTAITYCYVLCMILLRQADYIVIVSNTEDQASSFVSLIARAIKEIPELQEFGISSKLSKDGSTRIEGSFLDGHRFCVWARGMGQQIRGRLFEGRRPNLIIGDDMEDKDEVLSDDVRQKVQNRFKADYIPALARRGKFRVVGTILHDDSLLNRLLKNKSWLTARFRAHTSIDDFSELLWPERFTPEEFMEIKATFEEDGDLDGYAMEYLNIPVAPGKKMLPIEKIQLISRKEVMRKDLTFYMVSDAAVSAKQKRDYTATGIFGVDAEHNVYWLELIRIRQEADETIDDFFALEKQYPIEDLTMEKGQIESSLRPIIENLQDEREQWFELNPVYYPGDKVMKARPAQRMIKAGKIYVVDDIEYKQELFDELDVFPKGTHDDMVDILSLICMRIHKIQIGRNEEQIEDEFWEKMSATFNEYEPMRDVDTGY